MMNNSLAVDFDYKLYKLECICLQREIVLKIMWFMVYDYFYPVSFLFSSGQQIIRINEQHLISARIQALNILGDGNRLFVLVSPVSRPTSEISMSHAESFVTCLVRCQRLKSGPGQ